MAPLVKTLLWFVGGSYMLVRSYQRFGTSPFYSCVDILLAAVSFYGAFKSYRTKESSELAHESSASSPHLTRSERTVFKTLGIPTILVGLILLGVSSWMARDMWLRVARWPRTSAVLLNKDISRVGARLVFSYEAYGRRFTGTGFRWGPEKEIRTALETYQLGTVQTISYNPRDPGEIETIQSYSWELFRPSIFAAIAGIALIVAGAAVYRWSYGGWIDSPHRD